MSDYSVLEELCRGVHEFREGETAHSVLTRLFRRYGYRIHSDFSFQGRGRSPLTYAAMFGNKNIVRLLIEVCEGKIHTVDNVSSTVFLVSAATPEL